MTQSALAVSPIPKILLASAQPDLLTKLQPALITNRLQVEIVPAAQDALVAMRAAVAPSLVLLDANLPGMDLTQLLAAAQEEGGRRFPIVLISDTVSPDWVERLTEGVIDDLIPSSAHPSYWQVRIHATLENYRMACELGKLHEDASQNVQLDRLTGAYNRESLLSMLFSETDRVQRTNASLCMILMDVDDFEHWNALYGIEACDDLLRQLVARTRRQLRSYDLLGRVGEDEFIVVLPGCSGVNAMMLAERLRQEVFSAPYKFGDENVRITACFGVAMSRGRSPVVVLRESERALEQAKQAGPESIHCFSEEGQSSLGFQLPTSDQIMSW